MTSTTRLIASIKQRPETTPLLSAMNATSLKAFTMMCSRRSLTLLAPEEAHAILHPFEAETVTPRVGEDVRNDEDARLVQDLVRLGRGGTVRPRR
jgi:hypothetical protein